MWYVEYKSTTGSICSALYHGERPAEKGAEGKTKFIVCTEVASKHLGLTLHKLSQIYGSKAVTDITVATEGEAD